MTNTKRIRNWTLMAGLLAVVGLLAACSGGTTSTSPTQPEARNFEAPDTIVIAGFDCTDTGGEDGLTIIFANQSLGTVNKYRWKFGDGTKSNEAEPIHTYSAAGEYLVTLTVTSSVNSDTAAKFCEVKPETTETAPVPPAEGEG